MAGGSSTDIVAISANGFPVASPEDFRDFLQAAAASGPGARKPTPIELFLRTHPAALAFVTTPRPAPGSFGSLAFYGVNAFKFTNARGASRFIRYQIIPLAGETTLSAADLAKVGPIKDGSQVWPAERERIELGTLSLDRTPAEQVKSQRALLFNPLSLTAGIEPSEDPVPLARPAAYGVSYGQRAQ